MSELGHRFAQYYDLRLRDKDKALKFYLIFMDTRPKDRKPLPEHQESTGIVVSYYDFVERRMGEIQEELFWQGKKAA